MTANISTEALPQHPNEPTILLNVGNEDPTRGDVAGWRGMARSMAAKLGARVVYADEKTVKAAFPDDSTSSYNEMLAKYIQEYNPPEAIFGQSCPETLRLLGQDPNDVYEVTRINEGITNDMLGENELVAHHLTPEMIAEEGETFDKQHPNIKKPLITVMLMSPNSDDERQRFAKRIVKLMSHYPEATIYLCGSRHTNESSHLDLHQKIEAEVQKQEVSDKIDVTGYKFDRNAKYNPYKGLIARSKHIVVWGSSQSLVSEALYSGKTVYLQGTYGYDKTKKKRLVTGFNELALDEAPLSREFEPFNITDQLVEKLIEQKDTQDADIDERVLKHATPTKQEEWDKHLRAIRRNHRAAVMVPKELRQNPDFVKAAIRVRGFSLQHFPEFQDSRDMVALALEENSHSIKFIGKALKGLKGFFKDLMNSVNSTDVFAMASEELRGDPAFAKLAISRNRSALAHVTDELKNDPQFIQELLKDELIEPEFIPAKLLQDRSILLQLCVNDASLLQSQDKYINDPDFAAEAIALNPACYKYFGHDVRADEGIAVAAISQDYSLYQNVPSVQTGNTAIIDAFLQAGGPWQNIDMQYLDDDMVRRIVPKSPSIMTNASDALRNDIDLARVVLETNINFFTEFSDEIRDNRALTKQLLDRDPAHFVYCGPKTRDTYKIVKAAVLKHPQLISSASKRLQRSPALLKALLAKDPHYFTQFPANIKTIKGIEEYAVKKHPRNLAYCSEEFQNRPDIIEDIIANRPEYFGYLALETRSDISNIKRVYQSGSEEAITSGIHIETIASNPDLFDELINSEPRKSAAYLISKIRHYDEFRQSRRMVLSAIERDPKLSITNALGNQVYRNTDFIREIASLECVKAEHFEYVDFIDRNSARAIIEVRPEFIENRRLRQTAFSSYQYKRLDSEDQQEARNALKTTPVKSVSKTLTSGIKSLKTAFGNAVSGNTAPFTTDQETVISETPAKNAGNDPSNALIKGLYDVLEGSPASNHPLKIDNGLAKKLAHTYNSTPGSGKSFQFKTLDLEIFTKHNIDKEYIPSQSKHFKDIDYFATEHFNSDSGTQYVRPKPEIEINGQKYKLLDTLPPNLIGIDDWTKSENKDLSDHSQYPNDSIVQFVKGTSQEVAVYAPIPPSPEHHLDDGTICEYDAALGRKYVEQVGQDIWVKSTPDSDPFVIRNSVIGPAKDGTSTDVIGIYKRTDRKTEISHENKKGNSFKKVR